MTVLLYAPCLTGHPQVYCRVIGRALLNAGIRVVIASGTSADTWPVDWRDLRVFEDESDVSLLDTRSYSQSGDSHLAAEELRRLQRDHRCDATLFIEGDYFEEQFRRIATGDAPRLHGRICAIFANTCQWCPGEAPYSGNREPWIGPTMRRTFGRARDAIFRRKQSARYFYEAVLLRDRVVDEVIVKDERVGERFGGRVHWMPEIYRVFDEAPAHRRMHDWDEFAAAIQNQIRKAGASNVLLYFGTGAWYKGYDYFLKLAELDDSTFALHAGAPERVEPSKPMAFDTHALRGTLRDQGRLFETRAYVDSADLVDLLFDSIERFVSTHRLTLSSGTVLQALEAGKPVLTPATGLVGWRTQQFGLGRTYQYCDAQDLALRWREFRETPRDLHRANIERFMSRFSQQAVESFFVDVLTNGTHAA